MKETGLVVLGVLAILSAPVRAAHIQVPVAPASAPALFAPAPARWGQAFESVSRFLGTEAGAALSAGHPFIGDLKGYDAASPEALSVVAPMVEAIAEGHPGFYQHMARVAELDASDQKVVLAVVAFAQQKGAKAVEDKVAAEIERAVAAGDLEALKSLAKAAPAYSLYGNSVHQSHARAFVLAEETARRLRDGKDAGGSLEPGAVRGLAGTPAAPLAKSTRGELQSAPVVEPSAPSASPRGRGSFIDGAVLTLLGSGLAYLFFQTDHTLLGALMTLLAAMGASLAIGSLTGAWSSSEEDFESRRLNDWESYQADREAARMDAKAADHYARSHGDPPENL